MFDHTPLVPTTNSVQNFGVSDDTLFAKPFSSSSPFLSWQSLFHQSMITITITVLSCNNYCIYIDNIIFLPDRDHHRIDDYPRDQAININEFTSLCTNLIRSELGIPYKVLCTYVFLTFSFYALNFFFFTSLCTKYTFS